MFVPEWSKAQNMNTNSKLHVIAISGKFSGGRTWLSGVWTIISKCVSNLPNKKHCKTYFCWKIVTICNQTNIFDLWTQLQSSLALLKIKWSHLELSLTRQIAHTLGATRFSGMRRFKRQRSKFVTIKCCPFEHKSNWQKTIMASLQSWLLSKSK